MSRTRIRIVCTSPPQPKSSPHVVRYAVGSDVRVYAIDDDGTERALESVTSVRWECEGPNYVPRATIEVLGAELDVEAVLDDEPDDADSTTPTSNPSSG